MLRLGLYGEHPDFQKWKTELENLRMILTEKSKILFRAIQNADRDEVEQVLSAVDLATIDGNEDSCQTTSLHLALKEGTLNEARKKIVRCLLDRWAQLKQDEDGITPLHYLGLKWASSPPGSEQRGNIREVLQTILQKEVECVTNQDGSSKRLKAVLEAGPGAQGDLTKDLSFWQSKKRLQIFSRPSSRAEKEGFQLGAGRWLVTIGDKTVEDGVSYVQLASKAGFVQLQNCLQAPPPRTAFDWFFPFFPGQDEEIPDDEIRDDEELVFVLQQAWLRPLEKLKCNFQKIGSSSCQTLLSLAVILGDEAADNILLTDSDNADPFSSGPHPGKSAMEHAIEGQRVDFANSVMKRWAGKPLDSSQLENLQRIVRLSRTAGKLFKDRMVAADLPSQMLEMCSECVV